MDFTKMKLDTTSEYVIDNGRSINVMVEGLEDDIRPLFIKGALKPDYIDTYVDIDPVLEIATNIEFIAKYFDDTEDSIVIKLDNGLMNEGIDAFYTIMVQDKDGALEAVLKEAKDMYHADRTERVGCIRRFH